MQVLADRCERLVVVLAWAGEMTMTTIIKMLTPTRGWQASLSKVSMNKR